jgi:hypothetical protein
VLSIGSQQKVHNDRLVYLRETFHEPFILSGFCLLRNMSGGTPLGYLTISRHACSLVHCCSTRYNRITSSAFVSSFESSFI